MVLSAGFLSTPLQAQTTNWRTGTGSWFTPGNWDGGVPTPATSNSNVTNGGTAQIAGGAANTGNTLTISGGSTVELQAGGSLVAGTVVLANNGTLLLSGSTAVGANCVPSPGCIGFSPFSGIEFNGGTVRSTTTGSMPSSIKFAPDASGTILAAAGQTLTISGDLFTLNNFFGNNVHLTFGSTTDTGTIVFAPVVVGASFPPGNDGTIEVAGGTLRAGNIGSTARATIVDAGAKLDLSPNPTQTVFNLLGAGRVLTGNNPLTVLTINRGDFSGQIGGAAQVQVATELFTCFLCPPIIGTLRLSGVNTYTGGTTISSGILEIGNIGSLGAGPVTIDGTNSFRSSLRSSVSGTLTNNFTLQGRVVGISAAAGQTLTLASSNFTFANTSNPFINFGTPTDTGTVVFAPTTISMPIPYTFEIDGGTLRVAGSIASSSMTIVNAGATLGGNGIVGNTTINGGTLSPGNSIGLLTVQGSLVFTAASSYMVEVSPANADRVNVTGMATLGGATVNASFAAGTYVAKQYTILKATGGVVGTFNGPVNTNLPAGFKSSVSYDVKNAFLNLALDLTPTPTPTPNPAPTPNTGLNVNQTAVANAIVGFFNSNGSIPIVFGSLTPAGLTQVSGETATGSQQTTFDAMTQFLGALLDPFIGGRGDASAPVTGAASFAEQDDATSAYASGRKRSGAERAAYGVMTKAAPRNPVFDQRWSVWTAGFGGSQTTDGNAVAGSNSTTSRVFGAAVGADYIFSPHTIAGFALAGGGTNFSVANGGSGRSDLFQAGAFIRHTAGNAYFSGALAFGWQDITTDRTVAIAGVDRLRAEFNANAFSGRLEGGYRFVIPWMGGVGITPYAAGQFTVFDLPAYAEQIVSGANNFALAYAAKSVTASRSELGLRADKSFAMTNAVLTLRGRAAWVHDFNADRNIAATFQTLPGASFVVNGAAQGHDAALTTASAEIKWLNGFSLAAVFESEFSAVTRSYAGKGVARYVW